MNEEQIRRLIREAGADAYAIHDNTEQLKRFAELVAAAERERWSAACAASVRAGLDGFSGKAAVAKVWYAMSGAGTMS